MSSTPSPSSSASTVLAATNAGRLPPLVFLILQVAIVGAGLGFTSSRLVERRDVSPIPALRDVPLTVLPEYDNPLVVTDEQLTRILRKLVPRFNGSETRINHVDHALRFWGIEANFDDPQLLSGEEMRRLLVDHRRFVEVYGPDEQPLLFDEGPGVGVRVEPGRSGSSHVDHTLACLAEVGTPLDLPVFTPTHETTYRAILEQTIRDFSLNQVEYEWSALTFALFMKSPGVWTTTEGQRMSFDRIAQRIMREEMPEGVCFGNHRLHTLVMLLRVDDQTSTLEEPILSEAVRGEIIAYLKEQTTKLVAHQHVDGFWNGDWPNSTPASRTPTDEPDDSLADRILATGHALEWWSFAPREVHPPRNVLANAGQWLVRSIDGLSPEEVQESYTFLTHAGRSLALWRSVAPAEADLGL